MPSPRCRCSRPTRDGAYLCDICAAALKRWLTQTPELNAQLDLTITRQTAVGGQRVGARSTDKPVPWNDRASQVQARLHACINRWAFELGRSQSMNIPNGCTAQALFLRDHLHLLRLRAWAGAAWNAVHAAVSDGWRAIDRPADKLFAGVCSAPMPVDVELRGGTIFMHMDKGICRTELYAAANADIIECPNCHARHDVAVRRAWLLSQVEDVLWPARGIADALTGFLGQETSASAIRGMARRGEIAPRGQRPSLHGEPTVLYRVGDVIDVLTRRAARKTDTGTTSPRKGDRK